MRVTNNRDVNTQQEVRYVQEFQPDNQDKSAKKEIPDNGVEVSLSTEQERKAIMTDEALNCALENVLSSESNLYDVQQAGKMIAEANRKILEHANESILAQANQTPPMVMELTQ